MAEKNQPGGLEEEAVQRTRWGYAGKATLWLALILAGLALERLGLTSGIFSELLPGEVQTLRAQIAETHNRVLDVRKERDDLRKAINYVQDAPERLKRCLAEVREMEARGAASPSGER